MKFIVRRWRTGGRITNLSVPKRNLVPPLTLITSNQSRPHTQIQYETFPTTSSRPAHSRKPINTSWTGVSPPSKDYATNQQFYSLVSPSQYMDRFEQIQQRLQILQSPPPRK